MDVIIGFFKHIFMFCLIAVLLIMLTLIPYGTEAIVKDYKLTYTYNWTIYINEVKNTSIGLLSGDGLGNARVGTPVFEHIERYLLRSLHIIIPGFILSLLFGLIKGLLDYRFELRSQSIIGRLGNILFSSLPDFFVFILIQYSFLLLARAGFPRVDLYGFEHWYNTLLPLLALLIFPVFYLSKIVFTELKSEERNDYVITAKSKGIHSYWVVHRHILKNCLQTIMAHSQTVFIFLLSSLPIIELLSAYNGAGYQLMLALRSGELKLALGYLLVFLVLMYVVVWVNKLFLYIVKKERHSILFTNRTNHNSPSSNTKGAQL